MKKLFMLIVCILVFNDVCNSQKNFEWCFVDSSRSETTNDMFLKASDYASFNWKPAHILKDSEGGSIVIISTEFLELTLEGKRSFFAFGYRLVISVFPSGFEISIKDVVCKDAFWHVSNHEMIEVTDENLSSRKYSSGTLSGSSRMIVLKALKDSLGKKLNNVVLHMQKDLSGSH